MILLRHDLSAFKAFQSEKPFKPYQDWLLC